MSKFLLYILSLLYGVVMAVRNGLYDLKIFNSTRFRVPVISVGNITVGGTGKTPHIEYLVSLLKDQMKVAVLSRGYKRKTRGFRYVEQLSVVMEVGDEPLQIKTKFPDIIVAVDEKRVHGINRILSDYKDDEPDVILLDDAFQHRSVIPDINILLVDYNRPLNKDRMLPAGRLRESEKQMRRAGIIIYTKCPSEIQPIFKRIIVKNIRLRPYQELYFTRMKYDLLQPVFPNTIKVEGVESLRKYSVVLVTGIANPAHLEIYLQKHVKEIVKMKYRDHHQFTTHDLERVAAKFEQLETPDKIIVTTEKDKMWLKGIDGIPEAVEKHLFFIPVKISFLEKEAKSFNNKILRYVRENKSNRNLHKRTGRKTG